MDTPAADPAIGKDVQAHVRDGADRRYLFARKELPFVRGQLCFGNDDRPGCRMQPIDGRARREASFERGAIWIVALEMIRVDLDFRHDARGAVPGARTVVAWTAARPRP